MPDVQRFLPAAVLGVGCVLLFGIREQEKVPPRAPMATIQLAAPGYRTRDVVIDSAEQKIAGMSDYVMRAFQRDSTDPGFSVYVGYYDYQIQGKTIHSPKNCLPGAGWEAMESGVKQVSVGGRAYPMNRYLLGKEGAQALVYYWYQGRGRIEASEYTVKWNLMRDAALHGRTEEALVRIVVPVDVREVRAGRGTQVYGRADSVAVAMATQLIPRVVAVLPTPPGT
jgi:EpsI family protein